MRSEGAWVSTASVVQRVAEPLLWAVAGLSFVVLAWAGGNAMQARRLSQSFAAGAAPVGQIEQVHAAQGGAGNSSSAVEAGQVIGRVEIPALHLEVPITAGVETKSLLRGVGHVQGTALPGGLGTMVLAGHRDTYLRPLERIRVGMDIRVTEGSGVFHYVVDRWEVVTPDEVESIAIKQTPELALVTCYPFHYIGPAPKRFIVHAHLASLIPDKTSRQ
jgi:sortase A